MILCVVWAGVIVYSHLTNRNQQNIAQVSTRNMLVECPRFLI